MVRAEFCAAVQYPVLVLRYWINAFAQLTIVDDFTHEAVAIEVERAASGQILTRVLDRLMLSRGPP